MLVVIGHLISTVRTDTALGFGLYAFIYLFHMPAMIFLSGVFAKPEVNPKAITSTVQLLVVWLTWEGIWAVVHAVVEGKALSKSFLVSPAWTLWFLVSLATMRILLPYIARLKHPLIVSIVLALVAPLSSAIGTEFSAARTFAFLPFFVAGWLVRERGWLSGDWFLQPGIRVRAWAWAALAAVAAVIAFVSMSVSMSGATQNFKGFWRIDKWLTHRDSYAWMFANAPIGSWEPPVAESGAAGWFGFAFSAMFVSMMLMIVAAVMTLAILLVAPRQHSFISVWGTRTLYVYLLHGPIVWVMRQTGFIDAIGEWGGLGIATLIGLACVLTALLSMRWITVLLRPMLEPRLNWLMKPNPSARPHSSV